MRLLVLCTQAGWGGGESLMLAQATAFAAQGHAVTAALRTGSAMAARWEAAGHSIAATFRGKGRAPGDLLRCRAALQQWAPDVVIANDPHAVLLMGALTLGARMPRPLRVAQKHNAFAVHSPWKYRRCCDLIVCVSPAVEASVLAAGVPASRVHHIAGAVDLPAAGSARREAVRAEWQLAPATRLLVNVANLREPKGHDDLLHAMALLIRTHPDVVLLVAGDGPRREALAGRIVQLGLSRHVRLLGFRTDADALLAAADVVVHPARMEALGLVLIQAQLLCTPLVATAVGGAVEVLQAEDAAACSAWIARPSDPGDLARQLRAALDGTVTPSPLLQARLEATAARMRDTYGLQQAAGRWIALLERHMHQADVSAPTSPSAPCVS